MRAAAPPRDLLAALDRAADRDAALQLDDRERAFDAARPRVLHHQEQPQHAVRRGEAAYAIRRDTSGVVELGRAFIPPAPLRMAGAEFGTDFDRQSFQMVSPLTELKSGGPLRLDGVTAIKAPLGLREKLQHRWYENGNPVCTTPFYNVVGGREEGFRLWTGCAFSNIQPHAELRLDIETEGGQLVGRAKLKAGS